MDTLLNKHSQANPVDSDDDSDEEEVDGQESSTLKLLVSRYAHHIFLSQMISYLIDWSIFESLYAHVIYTLSDKKIRPVIYLLSLYTYLLLCFKVGGA